ncbi:MAG: hypothetical protein RLZZ414_1683, partial [Bacteroidota bacterium]
ISLHILGIFAGLSVVTEMKKLIVLILLSLWLVSCNKKEDKSIINKWAINSLVEDFNSVSINFNGSMTMIFKEDYTVELKNQTQSVFSTFEIVAGNQIKIYSFDCEDCVWNENELKLIENLTLIKNFVINQESLNLTGPNQLKIRAYYSK